MKKKHILFLLFCLMGATVFAQSAAEAKSLYEKGEYAQAKPALKKLVKSQPANGNYNLWYGVCCLKTGEASVGLKYLENAVKRRVPSGQLYLGQTYNALVSKKLLKPTKLILPTSPNGNVRATKPKLYWNRAEPTCVC